MPGIATGSTQPGPGPTRNVTKSMAPQPPTGQRRSSSTRTGSSSSGNFPDVTAGIVDIYDPGNDANRTEAIEPDYPMDSLPRHASTRSLPNQGTSTETSPPRNSQSSDSESQNVSKTSPNRPDDNRITIRNSSRSTESVPVLMPITSISSSTGNQPIHVSMAGRVSVPPQVLSMAHAFHSNAPPAVSQPSVNVSVSHASLSGNNEAQQIRTQDINIGIVSRLDNRRSTGSALPDLVANSQPTASTHPVSSSQRTPVPTGIDPRMAQSLRHSEPHSRHRHRRDPRHGGRSRRHSHRHSQSVTEGPCKGSCFKCLAVVFSFRWILVVLSLLGVCCVVTGIVLAALHAAGNSFLFLAIMFIGLGVLLVVVVGVGWKCTPRGHEPLHALFNLGEFRNGRRPSESGRRHRHPRSGGRWHGGAMYPEFQYRRPPPSYTASMADYQNQIMAAQQNQTSDLYDPDNIPDEDYSLPSSPPPSYRSRASTVRAGIQITFPPNQGGDFPDSRPPTYRSHPSGTLQGRHSRPSLSRDDDHTDNENPAPADVAFTGSAVIVDTNSNQNGTNIQIAPHLVGTQNVTVSVTTVSVTTSPPSSSAELLALTGEASALPSEALETVDPVGEGEADKVQTAL